MAASNINRVIITGNLTRDPELRSLQSGTSVCSLRLACNTRRKNNQTGEWEDKPNYFDVTVWGRQGENAAQYLSKGRPVAIDGRLEWREWQDKEGNKRQSTEIIADNVQFLQGGDGPSGGGNGASNGFSARSDVPVSTDDFAPAAVGGGGAPDDDIPF
jgi:single-strand DNA-binding protein